MKTLKAIVNGQHEKYTKVFDLTVQTMIVISLLSLTLETLPNLNPETRLFLKSVEVFSLLFFLSEYFLRIYSAERARNYIFSFWGVVDFVSIAPTLILPGMDTRAIRALRMLRLFRIFKLGRQSRALDRMAAAVKQIKSELIVFAFASVIVFYFSGALIYFFEHEAQPEAFASIPHSLWWAVATLTTVGYGDIYPITAGGKICTFFILMVGLGLVAIPSGLIASALGDDNLTTQVTSDTET